MPHDQTAEGSYLGHPGSARFEETQGGTRYFAVRFNLSYRWNAEAAEWQTLPAPREAVLKLWLSAKAKPYTMRKLTRVGFGGDFANPSFSGPSVEEGMQLVCTHNEAGYEEWDLPKPASQGQAPDDGYIRQLNAEWQNEMGAGSPSPPPSGAAGGPVGDGTDAAKDGIEPPF